MPAAKNLPTAKPGSQFGAHTGTRNRLNSTLTFLKRSVLLWLQERGLLQAYGELRSCFYRIVRPERIIGVPFEELRERMRMAHCENPVNQTGKYPFLSGIEKLHRDRPWLTWQDAELFLQGWFHAEVYLRGNVSIERGTPVE